MWLLKHDVAGALLHARQIGLRPTPEQYAEFSARCAAEALSDPPRNLRVNGDTATIRVEGILTPKPDLFAWLFGGGNTTYESIQNAIGMAEADASIKKVQFDIHSPGGYVDGLFETLAAIESMTKKRNVRASMADSAAFAIAAVAGNIEAVNPASEFGSIGVAVQYLHFAEAIDITSSEAPNKRPDPSTEEGKATIREYLDALHELFADAIARGRGTTVADVNANFGRGSVLLAKDAKKRGMIDRVAKPALRVVTLSAETEEETETEPRAEAGASDDKQIQPPTAAAGLNQEKMKMTEEELRAQQPALYVALIEKGEAQGVTKERDRVGAHLEMGQASGDMKTALEAVTSGADMTKTITAKYLAAGMNRADRRNRQDESETANQTLRGARAPETDHEAAPGAADMGNQVATRLEELLGVGKAAAANG